jgi:hypothetical protein
MWSVSYRIPGVYHSAACRLALPPDATGGGPRCSVSDPWRAQAGAVRGHPPSLPHGPLSPGLCIWPPESIVTRFDRHATHRHRHPLTRGQLVQRCHGDNVGHRSISPVSRRACAHGHTPYRCWRAHARTYRCCQCRNSSVRFTARSKSAEACRSARSSTPPPSFTCLKQS